MWLVSDSITLHTTDGAEVVHEMSATRHAVPCLEVGTLMFLPSVAVNQDLLTTLEKARKFQGLSIAVSGRSNIWPWSWILGLGKKADAVYVYGSATFDDDVH